MEWLRAAGGRGLGLGWGCLEVSWDSVRDWDLWGGGRMWMGLGA